MTVTTVIGVMLGVGLIISGGLAFIRQETMASPDGENERPYEGVSAMMLGVVWIVLGASVLALTLAPESTGGPVGFLRAVGRTIFEN